MFFSKLSLCFLAKLPRLPTRYLTPFLLVAGVLQASPRPNVIVFLIDDLGRSDVAIDGSTFHETPHLDALAKSGVRFTDFYSAHPVCSPTRAALMTGKVPQRVGITDWIHPQSGVKLPDQELTLGEAFQESGYQTAYFGKWHLGEEDADQPTRHGFDWIQGVNRAGQPGSYYFPFKRNPKADGGIWDVPDFEQANADDYLTDVLTGRAIDYLKTREPSRPFFICFGHYAIHTPIQPPKSLVPKYLKKQQTLFANSDTPTLPAPYQAASRGRQDNAEYAAMMENLDTNIGRVVQTLKESKLLENTIIVFTSDNGGLCTLAKGKTGPTCNLPFRSGKGWTYEGGIRISTFIAWENQLKPNILKTPAYTPDLYPTLLELCGIPLKPQQHVDGRSLASLMRGDSDLQLKRDERTLAWYYPHDHGSGHQPSAAIRKGAWKLIRYLKSEKIELYDLDTDPGEQHDLSSKFEERAQKLNSELLAWIAETTAK